MNDLDIEAVRSQFPALASSDQVFFDNAGGSQILGTVVEAISDYLVKTNVQLGASYKTGKLATERYNAGFAAGARYINAAESEIVFGASTTQLFRNVSFALSAFASGDEIILSSLDHEANIAPWLDLASRQGLVVKWWTPSPFSPSSSSSSSSSSPPSSNPKTTTNPRLLPSNLTPLLTPRTRLVAFTHVSNVLGGIHPVAALAAAVRAGPSPGALVVVDGVSFAPHRAVDVRALGVDVYAFSWYKVYGPHVAMLYAGPRAREKMRSLGHFFKAGDTLEDKIGLAGASYELLHAIPAVTAYLTPSRWSAIESHEAALQTRLLTYLTGRPDVTVYGDTPSPSPSPSPSSSSSSSSATERVPTISFRVSSYLSRDVVAAVEAAADDDDAPFGFRWGSLYSVRLVRDVLGVDDSDGVVRVSLVHYNSLDEVERFINAMEKYVPSRV